MKLEQNGRRQLNFILRQWQKLHGQQCAANPGPQLLAPSSAGIDWDEVDVLRGWMWIVCGGSAAPL